MRLGVQNKLFWILWDTPRDWIVFPRSHFIIMYEVFKYNILKMFKTHKILKDLHN